MKLELPANWQPKLIGLVTAFAYFVQWDHKIKFPEWMESLAEYVVIGGIIGIGSTTKAFNVTGGTVANKRNNSEVVAANAGLPSPNGQAATTPPPAK